MSLKLAKELDLAVEKLPDLAIAARYHDIGKIKIPKRILNKAGKLTEEEKRHIMVHSKYSSQILEKTGHAKSVVQFAMLHHENFDGSGYPFGYKGGQIPIEARIVRVADVFDALTSERSYKVALSINNCLKILHNEKIYFDTLVIFALLEIVKNNQNSL